MFGPEHPEVAFPLTNLADLYREQGRYTEAEPLYQRALHIREQALGSSHPQVAFPLNGLADLYREQGRYEEAEPLYQRALAIRYQREGRSTLKRLTVCRVSRVYTNAQPAGAGPEPLSAGARIREQRLGPEHPRRRKPVPAPLTSYGCAGVWRKLLPWKQLPASKPQLCKETGNAIPLFHSFEWRHSPSHPVYFGR